MEPTEKQWQAQVVQVATLYRWTATHHLDSRGTLAGWPDLSLIRVPELVFAELKTERGKLSQAQEERLEQLRACGQEVHVWRPSDFDAVLARLR